MECLLSRDEETGGKDLASGLHDQKAHSRDKRKERSTLESCR